MFEVSNMCINIGLWYMKRGAKIASSNNYSGQLYCQQGSGVLQGILQWVWGPPGGLGSSSGSRGVLWWITSFTNYSDLFMNILRANLSLKLLADCAFSIYNLLFNRCSI